MAEMLEVVSKPQIRLKGKAQADPPSPSTSVGLWRDKSRKRSPANGGMSKYIYRRSATQPLRLRWGFETASKDNRRRDRRDDHCNAKRVAKQAWANLLKTADDARRFRLF